MESPIEVCLESGDKRTFALALHWPGWCRSGRGEDAALQALLDYGPRYARVLHDAQLTFQAPLVVSAFTVIERLAGNSTTDFGVPERAFKRDTRPLTPRELSDYSALLRACWRAFDSRWKLRPERHCAPGRAAADAT
jgi:hypothetical protein